MGHTEQIHASHESGNFLSSDSEEVSVLFQDKESFQNSSEYNPVAEMSMGKIAVKDGVEFRRVDFLMRDGTIYDGSFARPIDVSNINPEANPLLDIRGTGWFTHPRMGMNRRDQLKDAVLLGQSSLIVGPQQNIDRRGRMIKTGDDLLEMGRVTAQAFGYSTELVTGSGKSRGSMAVSVAQARAALHGMTVAYAEMNAQCGSKEVLTPDGVSTLLRGLRNEGKGFKELLEHSPRALFHFAKTGDIHPYRLFQQGKELPTLASEDTINAIDAHMPLDAFGSFVVDGDDILTQAQVMRNRLASKAYQFFTIDESPNGSHIGSVASRRRELVHVRRTGAVVTAIGRVANDMIAHPDQASTILHDAAVEIDPAMFISSNPLVHLQKAS